MSLNKHQIFAASDLDFKEVEIPEWGGSIRLKTMSLAEQMDYEKIKENGNTGDIVVALLLKCCVDDDGKHLFNAKDVADLYKKSTNVICRLFNEALQLNAIKDNQLETEAKNF